MQNYLEHGIKIIDRIMDWKVTFRIPFFSCINIVLPLSYRNIRLYSAPVILYSREALSSAKRLVEK
jgi:hypothetical protein